MDGCPGLAWPWSSPRLLLVAPTAAIIRTTFAGGGSRDLSCDLSVECHGECQCHSELETRIDATVVPCYSYTVLIAGRGEPAGQDDFMLAASLSTDFS